jgi:hypothetical protein
MDALHTMAMDLVRAQQWSTLPEYEPQRSRPATTTNYNQLSAVAKAALDLLMGPTVNALVRASKEAGIEEAKSLRSVVEKRLKDKR